MSDNIMPTAPGGGNTQYESMVTNTTHDRESGQLGADKQTTSDADKTSAGSADGAKTAENVRFGQAMNEGAMGGQTNTNESALADGQPNPSPSDQLKETGGEERKASGYGPGSGVGG